MTGPVHYHDYEPQQAPMHSNELAFLSSHGIVLQQTGGYAPTDPSVNPELAAAAVSATEAIIQTPDGKSVIAPIS